MNTPHYQDATITLHHGDCLEVLAELPDASVDAVVTDPPYALSFMGKAWDAHENPAAFQAWCQLWTAECLRVLKPGGHLLAFGGTRTWHRLACAVEDAGFEVRDSIAWLYGSGFPKSLDVSKAIDKAAPRVGMFDAFAAHFRERRAASGQTQKAIAQHFPSKTGGLTGCVWNWENGANVPTRAQWTILAPMLDLSDEWLPLIERVEAEREKVGEKVGYRAHYGGAEPSSRAFDLTAPATDAARTWQGWGTALKPAFEPVVVARKPLTGTVAANVLAHGTGALNIDACRIGFASESDRQSAHALAALRAKGRRLGVLGEPGQGDSLAAAVSGDSRTGHEPVATNPAGRWPANVVLDDTQAAALDEQSGIQKDGVAVNRNKDPEARKPAEVYGAYSNGDLPDQTYGGGGGASRFFYVTERDQPCSDDSSDSSPDTATSGSSEADPSAAQAGASSSAQPADSTTSISHFPTFVCDHVPEAPPHTRAVPLDGLGSRFTYVAKAPATERVRVGGTAHPTVKPLDLMRWLVRLVTPPGGTVLEPFAGSGTTVEAALLEGFHCIAIEREADYLPLIQQRIHRRRDPIEAIKGAGEDGGLFDLLDGEPA